MSRFFSPSFGWVFCCLFFFFCFFNIELHELLVWEINFLVVTLLVNIFSHSVGYYGFLCCAELFSFIRSHLLIFFFHDSMRWIQKDTAAVYVKECFMFSSECFIVSSLAFRSLIHTEFIFVCGVRECSNFILLHVSCSFTSVCLPSHLSLDLPARRERGMAAVSSPQEPSASADL